MCVFLNDIDSTQKETSMGGGSESRHPAIFYPLIPHPAKIPHNFGANPANPPKNYAIPELYNILHILINLMDKSFFEIL